MLLLVFSNLFVSNAQLQNTLLQKDLSISTTCMDTKHPCLISSLDCSLHFFATSIQLQKSIKQLMTIIDSNYPTWQGTYKNIPGVQSAVLVPKASSYWSASEAPDLARFNTFQNGESRGWAAGYSDASTYIQFGGIIPFQFEKIKLNGRTWFAQYIKSFKIAYSLDGIQWSYYRNGEILVGTPNEYEPVEYVLDPFVARAVRIYSVSYNSAIGCKLEFLLSKPTYSKVLANDALIAGVAVGFKVTASSNYDQTTNEKSIGFDIAGKLGMSGWCSANQDISEWIMVTSQIPVKWKKISTKGIDDTNEYRVTSYFISYSIDGLNWNYYQNKFNFTGNTDRTTEVSYDLNPFIAVAIRIHPVSRNGWICLRLEVYCSEV